MAIATINNCNAFHSLDLNKPRVSKHSRHLELLRGRGLGEGRLIHSSVLSPELRLTRLCPRQGPLTTMETGVPGEASAALNSGNRSLQIHGQQSQQAPGPSSKTEMLKSGWWPRAGRGAPQAAMGPQRSGCRGLSHNTNRTATDLSCHGELGHPVCS